MDQIFGVTPVFEPTQRFGGVGFGVLFKVDVVEQAGDIPEVRVVAEVFGVTGHGGGHHEGVVALVGVLHVRFEQGLGFSLRGEGHRT